MVHYAPKRGVESTLRVKLKQRIKRILKDHIPDVSSCGGTAPARKCLVVSFRESSVNTISLPNCLNWARGHSGTTFALIVPEQRRGFHA
jgi:hypothetical protein